MVVAAVTRRREEDGRLAPFLRRRMRSGLEHILYEADLVELGANKPRNCNLWRRVQRIFNNAEAGGRIQRRRIIAGSALILLLFACPCELRAQQTKASQKDVSLPAQFVPANVNKVLSQVTATRVALVIGNHSYKPPIEKLFNPKKDARDMCSVLRRIGFQVFCYEDVPSRREMEEYVDAYTELLKGGGIGLFYYAGHGAQFKGVNYLIPVSAVVKRERDLEYDSFSLNYLMAALQDTKNEFNIVILDACRNNPLPKNTRSTDARGGLSAVKGPVGTFIAFATAEGEAAYDGPVAGNGLFTKHILANLEKPGLKIEDVFKRVTHGVLEETIALENGPQVPWISASIRGEFCFVSCEDPATGELIARLRKEKDEEVAKLRIEMDLVEKQKRLMQLELDRKSGDDSELRRLRAEKAILEQEKKRIDTVKPINGSTLQVSSAQISADDKAQIEKLRLELAQLQEDRVRAAKARDDLAKLQSEKLRIEEDLKESQLRLKRSEAGKRDDEKKRVDVPPSF